MLERYLQIRKYSETLCSPLQPEDYVPQPIEDVSPPKWHLAHTTWFFETFVLQVYMSDYQVFNPRYGFLFNSYYEHAGERIQRNTRGNLIRPLIHEVYAYRRHVDAAMERLLATNSSPALLSLVELGLQHEQQHQELLLTDLKFILACNPLYPAYYPSVLEPFTCQDEMNFVPVEAGIYEIGYQGDGFCFDNELGVHKVYLQPYSIADRWVTAGEYLEFIQSGGYSDFRHWLAEGWHWVNEQGIIAPLYWMQHEGAWWHYTLSGLQPLHLKEPVRHISYYEADAYASWAGKRLPTEFEWEVAAPRLLHGLLWEWTQSAYLPYPGFKKAPGAIGEYNGKFMVNQMVLRGGSAATPKGHARPSYRNFFHPDKRWQYMGIRLAVN